MKTLVSPSSLPEMDRLTGIDPVHAAAVTLHELRIFFRTELPADFEARLVRRMELAYEHAVRRGRKKKWTHYPSELFQIFFRRWLAELLFRERRDLFWQLPPGYRYGNPVWPKFPQAKTAPVKAWPETSNVAPVEIIRPWRAMVRQSLPFVHGAELLAA